MARSTQEPTAVSLWADAPHAAVAGRILDLMGSGITPVAVGGARAAEVEDLARQLDCARYDDLRSLLVEKPAPWILFAATPEPGDAELLRRQAGQAHVLTLEPLPDSPETTGPPHRPLLLPSLLRSPGWRKAADPLEAIGAAQSLALVSTSPGGDGSLLALLFDAWRFVLTVVDLPDSIDATLAPLAPRPPDTLRQLTGHLTAHARLSDGRGVVIQVSDRGPACRRWLQLIGLSGVLQAGDLWYELLGTDGSKIDEHHAPQRHQSYADLVADQWQEVLLDRGPTEAAVADAREVIACCQACLLSIRTRAPENPRKLVTLNEWA